MRLPISVLSRVRGSVALVALVGCGSPAPAVPSSPSALEPVVEVASAPPDPVAYDRALEADRLARIDDGDVRAANERSERIERSVAFDHDERTRAALIRLGRLFGSASQSPLDQMWGGELTGPAIGTAAPLHAAGCGRG